MANDTKKAVKPKKERRFRPIKYFKEVIAELKKLTWPSGKELASHTLAVFAFLIGMAIIIGVLDFLFNGGVSLLTKIGA